MKILVAGGAGYIGSHMVYDLLTNGHEVAVVDNFSNCTRRNLEKVQELTGQQFPIYELDLRQPISDIAETNFDAVMHFAAYKSVAESVNDPLKYYENNIQGVINLLRWTVAHKIPNFIFSSTAAVYGTVKTLPVTEETATNPESPYGFSKLFAERVIKDAAQAHGLNTVCLRYFNVAGNLDNGEIGDEDKAPAALIPALICSHLGIRPINFQIFGDDYDTRDGTGVRDFVHVLDLVQAHRQALDYLKLHPGSFIFNLGSEQGMTVLEIVHAFEAVTGQKLDYKISPRRPGDIAVSIADAHLAQSELHWQPRRTVNAMIDSAWKWYKSWPSAKIPA